MKFPRLAKFSAVAVTLFSLSGCQSYQLPKNYSGPTAVIRSSSKQVNSLKGEAFSVSKVDGRMAATSPVATPRGAGPILSLRESEVRVPSQPVTLTLSGSTVYAADGVAMADSLIGGARSVTGSLGFTPKPNGEYRVKGVLEKGSESVWLVEEKTGKIVGQKIVKN